MIEIFESAIKFVKEVECYSRSLEKIFKFVKFINRKIQFVCYT